MSNNIELLSNTENFTIGTNSNLSEILANVVRVGTDTSNVTISIPQDISSSYNLILPVRQGASGESLVYGADGQLKWHDTTVLKQVVSVYGDTLTGNVVSIGTHDSPTYLDAYTANITPKAENSKIFVQFKVNYHAALSASNQISFFIKKSYDGNETIFTESLFGPYNAAGGFTGQYISNLVDQASTSNSISYQLGYRINGDINLTDVLGILGYDTSYNNTIVLQEFEGSGSNATSVWNKGSDSNGLYYNDGTVHIGSTKNALGSQNTPGVALELSGNLVGTHAYFSGEVNADTINAREAYFSANTLYINKKPVLNEDADGNRTVNTDVIVSDASNGLTIKAIGDNGSIILDPSGIGSIQLNGDVELSNGNLSAETFIGDLSGNVNAVTIAATTTTTNNLSLDGTLTTSNSSRVVGNLIPSVDDTYSLGAPDRVWKDVYIGPGSLYLNGTKILEDNTTEISMKTDIHQGLNIQTSGTGTLTLRSDSVTQINSGNTLANPAKTGSIILNANGGSISVQSDLVLQGSISMSQTGTSAVPLNLNDDVDVGGNLRVNEIHRKNTNYSGLYLESVKVDGSSITGQLIGNVTGHVTGTVSSLSNHTTDELSEGSTNKYFSTSLVDSHLEGGTGVSYSNGSISIGQPVGTSDNVQFNSVTIDGTLYSDDITGSNVNVSNDLVVSGNLTVNGTRTIVNATTLDIGDNKIVVNARGSTRDAGIIANVNGVEHEFIYSNSNNAWGTTGNLNIGGLLDTTGNVNLTNSAINIEFTDAGDGNSDNNTFLVVKNSNHDPWFQHKIVQENNDYDTYEISSMSDNTGANTKERLRLGGYQNQFREIQLVAQNGVKVWSSHSNPNVMGNILCDTVNGNLVGDVTGNVSGVDVTTLQGDVTILQTSLTTLQGTANAAGNLATTNATSISEINTSLITLQGTANGASNLATTNATSIGEINTSLTSLQTSVASKQDTITTSTDLTMQNLTLSGYLRGPTNMTIDPATHGDDTGTLIVKGDLQVLGTTTTINSETLTINDNSIILNNNFSGSSPNENAGIEIERGTLSNAIIQWNETDDQWEFYREGTGNLSNIKCDTINCDTIKVGISHELGSITATVSDTILTINGNSSISYGVYSFSGNITSLTTANFNYVSVNSQYIIYYTNNSGTDLTINNTIDNCKTNLSEALTVSNGNSVLFCITAIGWNYIMTISQLY